MKVLIKTLNIISFVALLVVALMVILMKSVGIKTWLLFCWAKCIAAPFLAPLLGRTMSLFLKENTIKPQTWLIIYAIIFSFFVFLFMFSSTPNFFSLSRDLPNIVSETYACEEGNVQKIERVRGENIIHINSQVFYIDKQRFKNCPEEISKVLYLPESNFVIDVYDSSGISLRTSEARNIFYT